MMPDDFPFDAFPPPDKILRRRLAVAIIYAGNDALKLEELIAVPFRDPRLSPVGTPPVWITKRGKGGNFPWEEWETRAAYDQARTEVIRSLFRHVQELVNCSQKPVFIIELAGRTPNPTPGSVAPRAIREP